MLVVRAREVTVLVEFDGPGDALVVDRIAVRGHLDAVDQRLGRDLLTITGGNRPHLVPNRRTVILAGSRVREDQRRCGIVCLPNERLARRVGIVGFGILRVEELEAGPLADRGGALDVRQILADVPR